MKGLFVVVALTLLGIAFSEPIRRKHITKHNRHGSISVRDPVGKCPEHDPANPVYLPDSDDCAYYYECSNGVAVENNCPPDLEFSPSKNVCTQCSESGCKAPVRHCASSVPPTTTEPLATDQTTPNDFLALDFYEPNGDCPKHDTNETIFLADTKNCTVYYMCSNGKAIANVCPPTTVFNSDEHICVSEDDYECQLDNEDKITVRKPDGECPEIDPPMSAYLPDTEDCTIYYECSNGVPIQNVCPGGLAFNPTLHVCDEPSHANCKASTPAPSSEATTSTAPTSQAPTSQAPTSTSS